jgi:hypothetical protein
VKANSTATGDGNCQAGLRLFERRERHSLGGGNAKDADADCRRERKKFIHSFLLWFVTPTCAPDLFECTVHSLTERLVARAEKSFHIFGGQSKTGEDIAIPFLNGCTDSISSG